jgi:cell division septum initiation protein DivIVA
VLANRNGQNKSLPTAFRGYDREAIDQYLEEVEAAYVDLASERDELRDEVERLTRDVDRYRKHEDKAKEALARAEQVAAGLKVQAQREIDQQREALDREIEASRALLENDRAASQSESDELLRQAGQVLGDARAQADAIVHGARMDAERTTHELTAQASAQSQAAERVLDDTRARLAAMVTDLIKQLPVGSAGTPGARPPQ